MIARATAIAQLALRFARVERVTRHEDGVRPETDTDHSIMLALVACDLAPEGLSRPRVAEFSVVHDLVDEVKSRLEKDPTVPWGTPLTALAHEAAADVLPEEEE